MKTLQLSKVNVGSHPDEIVYFEFAKHFHECKMEITGGRFAIWKTGKQIFSTAIELYEKDSLTITYQGRWEDGKRFRIVQPSDELRPLYEALGKNLLVIGSMFSDGYAVTFDLTN